MPTNAQPATANSDALNAYKTVLATQGWCVVPASLLDRNDIPAALNQFGQLVPQYNGENAFDVTLKPGFEKVPYSQSQNEIGPHTEAPAYSIPPKYLALYCHKQATCGGGQTLLADGIMFYNTVLDDEQKEWALTNVIEFDAAAKPGAAEHHTNQSKIMTVHNREPVLRFSYNLFRYGNVNPSQSDLEEASVHKKQNMLTRMANQSEKFFQEAVMSVLIPDNSLLIWDNHRLLHARGKYKDPSRHLTRYWLA